MCQGNSVVLGRTVVIVKDNFLAASGVRNQFVPIVGVLLYLFGSVVAALSVRPALQVVSLDDSAGSSVVVNYVNALLVSSVGNDFVNVALSSVDPLVGDKVLVWSIPSQSRSIGIFKVFILIPLSRNYFPSNLVDHLQGVEVQSIYLRSWSWVTAALYNVGNSPLNVVLQGVCVSSFWELSAVCVNVDSLSRLAWAGW